MFILASDLDRTLLPNGNYEYDDSMDIFGRIIEEEEPILIYATGRNLKLVQKAIEEYNIPYPEYLVAEVGTRIYYQEHFKFVEDKDWLRVINSLTKGWNIAKFKEKLSSLKVLELQEGDHQNQFKLSYYIRNQNQYTFVIKRLINHIIKSICENASIVYSINEEENMGYLDIIPKCTTKLGALEYLRERLGFNKDKVVYCGDSGNDLLPLTSGYKGILVKNATHYVKKVLSQRFSRKKSNINLYVAKGYKHLNGNYVSGNIEGLINFGFVSPNFV